MNRWDVYWADFPFEETSGSKERPIVICTDTAEYVLALRVTSHTARANSKYDYVLAFWAEAGLAKESVVRIDKIAQLEHSAIGEYIGRIQDADIVEIRKIMNRYKENGYH